MEDSPDLYHDRWQIETAIGEVETGLRGGADVVLRSRKPDLARREVYGLLCLHQAIRHLIVASAEYGPGSTRTGHRSPAPALPPRVTPVTTRHFPRAAG